MIPLTSFAFDDQTVLLEPDLKGFESKQLPELQALKALREILKGNQNLVTRFFR